MTLVIAGFDKDEIFFIADSGIDRTTANLSVVLKRFMSYQLWFINHILHVHSENICLFRVP